MRIITEGASWTTVVWMVWAGMAIISGCGTSSKSEETNSDIDADAGADAGPAAKTLELHCPGDLDETESGYDCIVEGRLTASNALSPEALVWVPGVRYILDGIVSIEEETTLTIEPGAVILGDPESPDISPSALFIARGSAIHAVGTAERPILFSSAKDPGARAPGDWGGIVIRGDAPVNNCAQNICSYTSTIYAAEHGGNELSGSSGTLAYVRIEFSGRQQENGGTLFPMDGLGLLGVGSKTDIHHIEVHRTATNGVAIEGGAVPLHHIVVTGAGLHGFNWSNGWIGRAQFVITHHLLEGAQQQGVSGVNQLGQAVVHDASPRSNPTLYNFTIAGSGAAALDAMSLAAGTAGTLVNFLVATGTGFQKCLDIQDDATWVQSSAGSLSMAGSIFPDMAGCFADDDTMGYMESTWWADGNGNRIVNVSLPGAAVLEGRSFMPEAGSPAQSGAVDPPVGVTFFEDVSFVGAMGLEDWTAGWTAFPEN